MCRKRGCTKSWRVRDTQMDLPNAKVLHHRKSQLLPRCRKPVPVTSECPSHYPWSFAGPPHPPKVKIFVKSSPNPNMSLKSITYPILMQIFFSSLVMDIMYDATPYLMMKLSRMVQIYLVRSGYNCSDITYECYVTIPWLVKQILISNTRKDFP